MQEGGIADPATEAIGSGLLARDVEIARAVGPARLDLAPFVPFVPTGDDDRLRLVGERSIPGGSIVGTIFAIASTTTSNRSVVVAGHDGRDERLLCAVAGVIGGQAPGIGSHRESGCRLPTDVEVLESIEDVQIREIVATPEPELLPIGISCRAETLKGSDARIPRQDLTRPEDEDRAAVAPAQVARMVHERGYGLDVRYDIVEGGHLGCDRIDTDRDSKPSFVRRELDEERAVVAPGTDEPIDSGCFGLADLPAHRRVIVGVVELRREIGGLLPTLRSRVPAVVPGEDRSDRREGVCRPGRGKHRQKGERDEQGDEKPADSGCCDHRCVLHRRDG